MNIREICSSRSTGCLRRPPEVNASDALEACAESLTNNLFDEFSIQLTTDAPSVHRELERRRRLRLGKRVVVTRAGRVGDPSAKVGAASQPDTQSADASATGPAVGPATLG